MLVESLSADRGVGGSGTPAVDATSPYIRFCSVFSSSYMANGWEELRRRSKPVMRGLIGSKEGRVDGALETEGTGKAVAGTGRSISVGDIRAASTASPAPPRGVVIETLLRPGCRASPAHSPIVVAVRGL